MRTKAGIMTWEEFSRTSEGPCRVYYAYFTNELFTISHKVTKKPQDYKLFLELDGVEHKIADLVYIGEL